jgi:hypothetical protein
VDGGRLTFARLQRQGNELRGAGVKTDKDTWGELLRRPACETRLIALPPGQQAAQSLAEKACAAIADADAHAEQDEDACSRAFNIEGVASVPGPDGATARIWVGLRSPLVDGKAVLLRLRDLTKLQFDGIALVDLGGFAVRDLAAARGALWVLAGPMADEAAAGSVWTVPVKDVTNGAQLSGRRETEFAPLPPFAEGLAIDSVKGDAFVIIDGDTGDGLGTPPTCTTDAGQVLRHLPTASSPTPAPPPAATGSSGDAPR